MGRRNRSSRGCWEISITTEVVFFHHKSRVTLFTDLIQQFPPDWFSGWRAIMARLDLMVSPEPSVPRKSRSTTIDRRAARRSLSSAFSLGRPRRC